MKKLTALALALVLLLACAVAVAESSAQSSAGILDLSKLTVSVVTNGRSKEVKLRHMTMEMALGKTENIPTMQVSFDNGKGQVVDAVMQIVGNRLLLSMGGVSGTYYIDLDTIGEKGEGALMAKAIGSALALAGPHLDVLLHALTTENSKGVRSMEIRIPDALYKAMAENLLSVMEGLDTTDGAASGELFERAQALEGGAVLSLRYKPKKGKIEIAALQNGSGLQLSANMELSIEEREFVNISADELQYDLTHLDEAQKSELRDELDIIALKFGKFALGTGLSKLLK